MLKLVYFDLDDTLIREIHFVMYLSILNNRLKELNEIESREMVGEYNWIQVDYLKAECAKGVHIDSVRDQFEKVLKPIKNIRDVVKILHKKQIKSILITAGPIQVAGVASKLWEMDAYFRSDYECKEGVFTEKIHQHIGNEGKIKKLQEFCLKENIKPMECMAIGDGVIDIPLFEYCGVSIGINCLKAVSKKSTYTIVTEDLMEILEYTE